MDTVELSGERQILMAALACRRRALPLRWPVRRRTVRRRTGVSSAEEQISLLRNSPGRFPKDSPTAQRWSSLGTERFTRLT